VLKKAKKIANGKGDANLSLGAFVDTLVVHPADLVQVIAKVGLIQWYVTKHCLITGVHDILSFFSQGLTLPIFGRTPDCNVVFANGSLKPLTSDANDTKMSKTGNISPLEYVLNSSYSYCFIFIPFGLYLCIILGPNVNDSVNLSPHTDSKVDIKQSI